MGVVDRPIAADHVVHAHSPGDVSSSCICRVNRVHFLDEFCGSNFCIADFDFWKRDEAVPAKSSVKKIEIADRFTLGLFPLVGDFHEAKYTSSSLLKNSRSRIPLTVNLIF